MTKLAWANLGSRHYETGIDRGVLYIDGVATPWNGLSGFEDQTIDESEPRYADGNQWLEFVSPGDFKGRLSAITYPDAFMPCEGVVVDRGVNVEANTPKIFNLCYRSLIGNDLAGTDFAYKIHILYNLTAVPSSKSYETITTSGQITDFTWDISGIPVQASTYAPTCHAIFDSRELTGSFLSDLENLLYGSASSSPSLPSLSDLISWVNNLPHLKITDNGDGTWSADDYDGTYVTMLDDTTFQVVSSSATIIDSNSYTVSSI